MPESEYQINEPEAGLVPFPTLDYLLTSEPVLGSSSAEVPNGPFNRLYHKLHKNVGSVAALFYQYLNRTSTTVSGSIDPNTYIIPNPIPGTVPDAVHNVCYGLKYDNYEVVLRYNGLADPAGWEILCIQAVSAGQSTPGTTVTRAVVTNTNPFFESSTDYWETDIAVPSGYVATDLVGVQLVTSGSVGAGSYLRCIQFKTGFVTVVAYLTNISVTARLVFIKLS